MTGLAPDIIKRVEAELGAKEHLPTAELYLQLEKYYISQHPDSYQEPTAKERAEEKFKQLGNLKEELEKYMELEKQQMKPWEMALYEKNYKIIDLTQEISKYTNKIKELEETVRDLQNTVNWKDNRIKEMRSDMVRFQSEEYKKYSTELMEFYKPKKHPILTSAVTAVIWVIVMWVTQTNKAAEILSKYSFFPSYVLNSIIFIVMIFIIWACLKQHWRNHIIEKFHAKVESPAFIDGFARYLLHSQEEVTEFSEYQATSFIAYQMNKGSWARRVFNKIMWCTDDSAINLLKNVFIYNLHRKKLIKFSKAIGLQVSFKIIDDKFNYIDTEGF